MGYSPLLIEMSKMTEENKTETTEVKKNVDAEETSTESTEETEEEASNIENKIDYKAIAEKAKEEGYNKGRADEAYKQRNKKQDKENVEEKDEDRPVTLKDLETFQSKQRQEIKNDFNAQQIQDIANRISSSDDEKEAILAVYVNRIFPENMSIQDQLTEVKLIVNKDKILGENSELKRALNSKANATKEHISGQHDSIPSIAGEPKLSDNRKEILKDFSYNKETKQYEKKSSSGTLVHDPKTGKNKFVPNS